MSIETNLPRAWPALLAALAVLALAAGCTQEPAAPSYDNPLDPDGPYQGDPFGIVAVYLDGGVFVTWTGLSLAGIVGYEVLHSLQQGGPFSVAGSVEYPTHAYTHAGYAPNRNNYYKVRAVDINGSSSAISSVRAAALMAPPYLRLGETEAAASRKLDLFVRAAVGDSAELSAAPDFASGSFHVFDQGGEVTVPWDLGAADGNGVWKHVYLRVYTGGAAGAAWHDSIEVAFAPQLQLAGNVTQVASMNPVLEILGDGVTLMRFADDRRNLPAAAWLQGDTLYAGYLLDAAPDSQRVFGEFTCDFGFTRVDSLLAVPGNLDGVTLLINGGAESTPALALTLQAVAVATRMRFAESVGALAATAWQDYAQTTTFTHGGCAGGLVKTVYGQFRNDWFDPAPVSASIQWLPAEVLDVTIAAADTVAGGAVVAVTGTAVAGTCGDPLDAVEFDGGGGWQIAAGLQAWSIDWTAPTVVEHTTLILSARVLAGAEADTATAEVVVAP
ncbi:hypothetical protein KKG45_02485 [bacterium]|nr:hypothetical protein [bacterium]MBU1072090.1 hypothetical protein [bacterium]MBU1676144.1 hypothetical protein [bacterium]